MTLTWREIAAIFAALFSGILAMVLLWWFTKMEVIGLTFVSILISLSVALAIVIGEDEG